MMIRITATAALALLAACGSASVAEQDAVAHTRAAARPLAIAGVRIGMPATEVQAALARDGWKVETFPGYDWATAVEEQKRQQRGASSFDLPRTGLATIQANKGDEALIVEFRPVPSGAEVKVVKYEAPMAGRTGAQLRAQLTQRYGAPQRTKMGTQIIGQSRSGVAEYGPRADWHDAGTDGGKAGDRAGNSVGVSECAPMTGSGL